jgi:hypothetical protein
LTQEAGLLKSGQSSPSIVQVKLGLQTSGYQAVRPDSHDGSRDLKQKCGPGLRNHHSDRWEYVRWKHFWTDHHFQRWRDCRFTGRDPRCPSPCVCGSSAVLHRACSVWSGEASKSLVAGLSPKPQIQSVPDTISPHQGFARSPHSNSSHPLMRLPKTSVRRLVVMMIRPSSLITCVMRS